MNQELNFLVINGEACKMLFKDLEDLHNNGMKIEIEDVEYTIYADLVAIVSDGLAMPYFFEFNGTGANYPCVFCKQRENLEKSLKKKNIQKIGSVGTLKLSRW